MPIIAEAGTADVTLSGQCTLTIQNPGGFATVEFPIGTVVWKGGEASKKLDLNGGTARITSVSRAIEYNVSYDDVDGYSTLASAYTIAASDDGKRFRCTTALTITIPAALVPRPEFTVMPPSTGNLSIAFSGGSQGNGAATTITRTRASNPAGVVITPWPDVTDGYGVSGA